jgi:hypothetical protein
MNQDSCCRKDMAVHRRRNERFARNCVLEINNFGGGSVITTGPLQVDADVSVQRQSKDVWRVSRFHGDGFWLSVPIFVGDLGHLMLFLLLPEWEVRKELRPWDQQFRRRKCDDVGCHIIRRKTQLVHIHGNLNAARHIDEVLKPHTLPAMDLRREVL